MRKYKGYYIPIEKVKRFGYKKEYKMFGRE